MADFTYTTTADFETGTKSASSGDNEIQTYTDNHNITANAIELGNKSAAEFTYADADAVTWMWKLSTRYAIGNAISGDIDTGRNNAMQLTAIKDAVASSFGAFAVTTDVSGNFDARCTGGITTTGAYDNRIGLGFYIDGSNWCYTIIQRTGSTNRLLGRTDAGYSIVGLGSQLTDIGLRIERVGSTLKCYS